MKNLFAGISAIILFCIAASAQGSSAATGRSISDAENGYSFTTPAGWKYQAADGGYLISNVSGTAAIVVKPHYYNDFDAFAAAEIDLESEGYRVAGDIQDLGNGGKMARVYNSNAIIDAFFMLSSYEGGVLVMSITKNAKTADEAYYVAAAIVKSIRFSRPQRSAQSSNYQAAFGGKKFTNMYSGNGYFEERVIWLCASGTYFSKTETGSSSSAGSGSTYSEDAGTWRVAGSGAAATLVLTSQRGKGQRNFTVTAGQSNSSVMMNGLKYYVEAHNQCR